MNGILYYVFKISFEYIYNFWIYNIGKAFDVCDLLWY